MPPLLFIHRTLVTGSMCSDMRGKGSDVPCLQVHGSRTGEAACQTFAGTQIGNDTSRSDTLHLVLAVPGDEVSVIHEIGFAVGELDSSSSVSLKRMSR